MSAPLPHDVRMKNATDSATRKYLLVAEEIVNGATATVLEMEHVAGEMPRVIQCAPLLAEDADRWATRGSMRICREPWPEGHPMARSDTMRTVSRFTASSDFELLDELARKMQSYGFHVRFEAS